MILRSRGFVIGRTNFGNTSQVVTLLTPYHGVLGLLAKGVWRPRNPAFTGPFDLACLYDVVFLPRRRAALGLLTEAQEVEGFRRLRRDRERIADVFLIIAFVRHFAAPGLGDEGFYRVVTETVRRCADGAQDGLFYFLKEGLRILGVFPSLDRCAGCGAPVREGRRFRFSFREGGILCQRHRGDSYRSLSGELLAACRTRERVPAEDRHYAAGVRFLLDWANFVLASRSRMLEYPFYLRPPA